MSDERTFYIGPSRQSPEDPPPEKRKEPSEAFRFVNELHNKTLEYQFSVARWIMASLLIINGGGILALMNAAKDFPDALSGGLLPGRNCDRHTQRHVYVVQLQSCRRGGN